MGPPTPITTSQRVLRDRIDEARQLYRVYDAPSGADHRQERRGTLGAGGWCDMPRTGARRFLVMDAGPVYSRSGPLFGFMKNLAMAGGYLLFVKYGAGSPSIDARLENR
jgi:hypothetical protein